jgi:hypothetical protein
LNKQMYSLGHIDSKLRHWNATRQWGKVEGEGGAPPPYSMDLMGPCGHHGCMPLWPGNEVGLLRGVGIHGELTTEQAPQGLGDYRVHTWGQQ